MFRAVSMITALLLGFTGSIAVAQIAPDGLSRMGNPDTIAQRGPGGRDGFLRDLNLSQDQIQKIQAIRNQYKDRMNQRRQAFQQAQRELRTLMAGTASRGQVQEKFRQVQSLRQQLEELHFNSMLEMREVLTPEQRQKFADRMQQGGPGRRGSGRLSPQGNGQPF
ncbi:MAG: Spy/CpxP family protein refolding chaperone [Leptolyngbyaceae cyanobacterium bins.59]|nr:Spy/CpxP family protein refolding chaperone [Leptolyngbyaceae cyanobacterium bins.59]